MEPRTTGNGQIISYQLLRMFVGIIGVLLPVIVIVGQWIQFGYQGITRSISASYYVRPYGDVLVGSLFVLGFFLLSYRGKNRRENWFANSGFAFSLGIALFPCESAYPVVRYVHYACAGLLFLMFALFSLWLFRESTRGQRQTRHMRNIDTVYVVTGWLLVACFAVLLVFVVIIRADEIHARYKPILFTETLGLFAFGYAWMTRAHFLWRNRGEYPNRWYVFSGLRG